VLLVGASEESNQRNNRMQIKDALINAANLKFDYQGGDDSCSICFEDYLPGEDIIRLPCDRRHYFHSACIGEWVKK
jgi:hypothetical protein